MKFEQALLIIEGNDLKRLEKYHSKNGVEERIQLKKITKIRIFSKKNWEELDFLLKK